jgi:hypothetical protein
VGPWVLLAAILNVLAWTQPARAEDGFLDGLVAQVDSAIVTASDVALGRALGLFGLTPTGGPLSPAEIQRYVDGQLLVREAARIGVEAAPAALAEAWAAVAQRAGGEAALIGWLMSADVDVAWARRLVSDDLKMRQFVDLRFRALAFISEADLATALGPGTHDEGTREAMRARLEAESAERRLGEWLGEARPRATISARVARDGQIPNPLSAISGLTGGH